MRYFASVVPTKESGDYFLNGGKVFAKKLYYQPIETFEHRGHLFAVHRPQAGRTMAWMDSGFVVTHVASGLIASHKQQGSKLPDGRMYYTSVPMIHKSAKSAIQATKKNLDNYVFCGNDLDALIERQISKITYRENRLLYTRLKTLKILR